MQRLSSRNPGSLFLGSLAAFALEMMVGFHLSFAPGWANGWPGGLTMHRVWAAGITILLFAMSMTAGLSVMSIISRLLRTFSSDCRRAEIVLRTWLVLWATVTALVCVFAYREIYASTLGMWPAGYPGG